jgi:hypothetical protein
LQAPAGLAISCSALPAGAESTRELDYAAMDAEHRGLLERIRSAAKGQGQEQAGQLAMQAQVGIRGAAAAAVAGLRQDPYVCLPMCPALVQEALHSTNGGAAHVDGIQEPTAGVGVGSLRLGWG